MYRIARTFEVESGHMLSKHPDKCKYPHGHSRKVEVVVECDTLDSNEMVCDFKTLKDAMTEFLKRYDHSMCMNTADPKFDEFAAAYGGRIVPFRNEDPTTEVLARLFYDYLKNHLASMMSGELLYPVRASVRVVRVRVSETSSTWAEYTGGWAEA